MKNTPHNYEDRYPPVTLEQGRLEHWEPIVGYSTKWTCGPAQIHDMRFVWWYRLWLWLKFRVLRRETGYWYARYRVIARRPENYEGMTFIYKQRGTKK